MRPIHSTNKYAENSPRRPGSTHVSEVKRTHASAIHQSIYVPLKSARRLWSEAVGLGLACLPYLPCCCMVLCHWRVGVSRSRTGGPVAVPAGSSSTHMHPASGVRRPGGTSDWSCCNRNTVRRPVQVKKRGVGGTGYWRTASFTGAAHRERGRHACVRFRSLVDAMQRLVIAK